MIKGAVVTMGRICAQKDPLYFAEAASYYTDRPRPWVWIGGADDGDKRAAEYLAELDQAGVIITGWLERDEALAWLSMAHVYVHTAAWEGNPVTVYEAAVRGLPVICRDIPAVKAEGIEYLTSSPGHMAGWVRALDDEYQWRRAAWWSMSWVREHMEQSQRQALREVYGLIDATQDVPAPR
jgi:glycosyltransferase involved in cell wall biosynthesis